MSKLTDIARAILVYGESQKAAAERVGLSEFSLCRAISGRTESDKISDAQHKAFVADFPILDALVAEEIEQDAVITFNGLGARTLIPILEAALKQDLTPTEQWSAHRLLARAYVETSQHDKSDALGVDRDQIVKAHDNYDKLTELKLNFSPQRRDIVNLGIRLNKLGLDMVLQGGRQKLIGEEPPLTGYEALMKELNQAYAAARSKNKVVSIGLTVEERVLRQMLLYCAHGICELSLEKGDTDKIPTVIGELLRIFRPGKRTLIGLLFLDMAWEHNKPKYRELFGLSESVLPQAG